MYDFEECCCLILIKGQSLKYGLCTVENNISLILIYLVPLENFIWDHNGLNEEEFDFFLN